MLLYEINVSSVLFIEVPPMLTVPGVVHVSPSSSLLSFRRNNISEEFYIIYDNVSS
jgi:hypothetical protein